jgi:hypothetical protein
MLKTFKNNQDAIVKLLLAAGLIILAIIFRLLPHPANFAPVAAVAIFGSAILPKKWALSLPLVIMVSSDLIIGFHSLIWVTWGSFLMIAIFSSKYLRQIRLLNVVGTSLAASLFFFLATNFGVWCEGRLYPLTFNGFINCYYNALPFFRNTLLGDLAFCGLLFGAYVLVYRYVLKGQGSLKIASPKAG